MKRPRILWSQAPENLINIHLSSPHWVSPKAPLLSKRFEGGLNVSRHVRPRLMSSASHPYSCDHQSAIFTLIPRILWSPCCINEGSHVVVIGKVAAWLGDPYLWSGCTVHRFWPQGLCLDPSDCEDPLSNLVFDSPLILCSACACKLCRRNACYPQDDVKKKNSLKVKKSFVDNGFFYFGPLILWCVDELACDIYRLFVPLVIFLTSLKFIYFRSLRSLLGVAFKRDRPPILWPYSPHLVMTDPWICAFAPLIVWCCTPGYVIKRVSRPLRNSFCYAEPLQPEPR